MEKLIHKPEGELVVENPLYIGRKVWYGRHTGTICEKPSGRRDDERYVWVKFDDVSYWGHDAEPLAKSDVRFEAPKRKRR